jgi:hypothetical protein
VGGRRDEGGGVGAEPTTMRWAEEEEEGVFGWGLLSDAYDQRGEACAEYSKKFYLGQSCTLSASPSRPSSIGNGSGCSESGSGGGTTTPDLFTMAGTSSPLAPSAPTTSRGSHDEHHKSVDPTPLPAHNDMW